MAVLRPVCRTPGSSHASVVLAMRPSHGAAGGSVPRLSARAGRPLARAVHVQRPGPRRHLEAQIRGVEDGGAGTRRRDGAVPPARCGCGDVGAARLRPRNRARLRPGEGARHCGGPTARPSPGPVAPARSPYPAAGSQVGSGPSRRPPRCLPIDSPPPFLGPPRRRRAHHGCNRFGLRASAGFVRRRFGPSGDGRPRVFRATAPALCSAWVPVRVCGCPGILPGSRRQPRAKRPT